MTYGLSLYAVSKAVSVKSKVALFKGGSGSANRRRIGIFLLLKSAIRVNVSALARLRAAYSAL